MSMRMCLCVDRSNLFSVIAAECEYIMFPDFILDLCPFAVAFLTKSLSKFLTLQFLKDSVDQSLQQIIRKNVYRKALPCKVIMIFYTLLCERIIESLRHILIINFCMPDILVLAMWWPDICWFWSF